MERPLLPACHRGVATAALDTLVTALDTFATRHRETAKVGPTFLRDAHCTTVGMEFGGFAALLRGCQALLKNACEALWALPQGEGRWAMVQRSILASGRALPRNCAR